MLTTQKNTAIKLNGGYRYSFQGQEADNEIKGAGNSINYTYRMHDPRVGRFFAVDPLAPKYAYNSPYSFSENRVVDMIELEGLEITYTEVQTNEGKTVITVTANFQIVNQSSDQTIDMGLLIQETESQFAKTYSGKIDDNTEIIFIANITEVSEVTSEFSIVLQDNIEYSDAQGNIKQAVGFTHNFGNTNKNQFDIAVKPYGVKRDMKAMIRTIVHEGGHGMGLFHPDIEDNFGDPSTASPTAIAAMKRVSAGSDFGQESTQVTPQSSPENIMRQSHRTTGDVLESSQRQEMLLTLKQNNAKREGASSAATNFNGLNGN